MGWSSGMEAITFLALEEVQTMSVNVLLFSCSAINVSYNGMIWIFF